MSATDELEAARAQKDELAALLKECLFHLLALHLTGASRHAGPLAERVGVALKKAGALS